MARKAAWESASDLGPYGGSGGTSWGRVFVLVLLVGMGTFVAAYYLPLYRAQQKLSEQFRDLSQKSQSITDATQKAQAELKSVTAERDQLQAEHDKRESAKKTEGDQLERLRADLSTKLDKFLKKGSAVVATNAGSELVAVDATVLFTPQKLELSPAGKALLCDVAKSGQGFSLRVSGSMAEDATLPAGLDASDANPWALSAARAAAVAQALEEKCAVPAAQLSATGNGKHEPLQAQLANLKATERIAIEFRSR
ncbi:MAG TPA: OmpA family protein [Polyangiaceae bacterium]|jgi:chemotaxis protein MotB|nr:OmpA family protein [Polyangiaceae bacterium]